MDWRGGWGKEEEEGEGGEEKGAEREIIFLKRKKAECEGEEGRGATATTVQKFKQLCLALLANRRLHQSKRLESRKISQGSPSNMSLLLSGNLFNNYHILPSGDLIFFYFSSPRVAGWLAPLFFAWRPGTNINRAATSQPNVFPCTLR